MAEEYLGWAKVNKRAYNFTKGAMKHLAEAFKGKTLGEITARQIEAYKSERAACVAPATINTELALLRHLYVQPLAWGKAAGNPVEAVKLFREQNERIRYLTADEEARLLAMLPEKYKPVVTVALRTGLRMGECRGLWWRDVDFEAGVITVAEAKGGEVQQVPMNSAARAILEALPRRSPYVFPDLPSRLSERFVELAQKAGVNELRFHDLRHTFCSRLVMAGVDIRTVQVLARHKEIPMTLRYAHLSEDYTRQAIERLIPEATRTSTSTSISEFEELVEIQGGERAGGGVWESNPPARFWQAHRF